MPRTTLTPQVLAAPFDTNPYTVLTEIAANAVDGNQFSLTGEQVLIVHNTDSGAHTITVTSVALNGRTKDVTALSVAAGAFVGFAKFNSPGWRQADGMLYFAANDATMKFLLIDLQNNRNFG